MKLMGKNHLGRIAIQFECQLQQISFVASVPGPDDDLGVVDVPADVQGELIQDLVHDLEESADPLGPCKRFLQCDQMLE